jgi:UDP-N-acetylglucosamine--N-acetylmuramyl-(pentapeptide) pyrophosphoryl-undecaprenol N-acetylglucosamine transferase
MEASLVQRENVPFDSIPAAGVHGVGLKALPGNLVRLVKGTLKARKILKEFDPDVILYTGGYVAAPMAVVARKRASILYVPDIEPGLALQFLARFSKKIALTTETSKEYFSEKQKLTVTGYPIRPQLAEWTREKGYAQFGLHNDLPVLLFMGGSQGARSINQALLPALNELLKKAQIIHLSGPKNWNEVEDNKKSLSPELAGNYHPFPYLHEEMGAALAAADLVISRAGASILGEYPFFGLPAVLVPYPYAWRYQKVNADYLQDRKAALILKDEDLQEKLLPLICELLDQPERLEEMKKNMKALSRPDAAQKIANLIAGCTKGEPH